MHDLRRYSGLAHAVAFCLGQKSDFGVRADRKLDFQGIGSGRGLPIPPLVESRVMTPAAPASERNRTGDTQAERGLEDVAASSSGRFHQSKKAGRLY